MPYATAVRVAERIAAWSSGPVKRLVACAFVIGRSVVVRTMVQGIPRIVVSSETSENAAAAVPADSGEKGFAASSKRPAGLNADP